MSNSSYNKKLNEEWSQSENVLESTKPDHNLTSTDIEDIQNILNVILQTVFCRECVDIENVTTKDIKQIAGQYGSNDFSNPCVKEKGGMANKRRYDKDELGPKNHSPESLEHCNIADSIIEEVSTLEREILLRGDLFENKKAPVLKLPPETLGSFSEKENVGDDAANSRSHILCECNSPGVAGGAVPIVTSFSISPPKGDYKLTECFSQENSSICNQSKQPESITHKPKPSLIPKLTSSFRKIDRSSAMTRMEKQSCLVSSEETKKVKIKLDSTKTPIENNHSKIRNSFLQHNDAESNRKEQEETHFQLENGQQQHNENDPLGKFHCGYSKNISTLSKELEKLLELKNYPDQALAIEKIYECIIELKHLSNQINDTTDKTGSSNKPENEIDNKSSNDTSENEATRKDKRIRIKLGPPKSLRKKSCGNNLKTETLTTNEDVVDITKKYSPFQNELNIDNKTVDKDSLDGMFIPSCEEPPKMEENEDDCLDLTITFPEFQQHIVNNNNSHMSVSFSDLSAEALGRLKRCPKEFTLKMDFVQGKMFFQTGNSCDDNTIGLDMKIVDNKMSDIINIKPSTECIYNSQIIPVEGANKISSIKTLKSTDSELFNVVSLPKINKRASGNTKSCINLKRDQLMISNDCVLSDGRSFKSMPQIPSLAKILEEAILEYSNNSEAASILN